MKLSTRLSRHSILTVLSVLLVCLSGQIAGAQAQGLTNADVEGIYAVSLTFGVNDGTGLGVVTADGNGNLLNGRLLLNLPGATEDDEIFRGQLDGRYTLNPNGTATLAVRFILPNRTLGRVFDVIVRQLDDAGVRLMFGALRERSELVPNAGATIELKRLPTGGGFDQSSLQGPLAVTLAFESQIAVGFGVVTADGQGNLTDGALLLNAAGVDPQMPIMRGQMEGTYTVGQDGVVAMHLIIRLEDGEVTEADYELMITEAQDAGNGKALMMRRANRLEGAPETMSVPGGNWRDTAEGRRFRVNQVSVNSL